MAKANNWTTAAESKFPWERDALDFVRAKFPSHDPYRAWANFEFIADDGSINEVDLLVFTPQGFFLIEIKSRPGRLFGDAGTWTWETDGKLSTVDNPLMAANLKAKKLRSLLQKQKAFKKKGQPPFVEALVFCSAPELKNDLQGNARFRVCLRDRDAADDKPARAGIMAVLKSSANVVPSSFRRVLLILSELHRMGFGRLRAATWMHQNGYIEPPGRWSCAIVPSVVLKDDHGAMTDGEREDELRSALGVVQHHDPWISLGNQPPFGWNGMCFESPRVLAEKFLSTFRELCFIGWGEDYAYQRWYEEMLSATAPYGVFYPIVNETEYVMAAYTGVEDLRLPPPPIARG